MKIITENTVLAKNAKIIAEAIDNDANIKDIVTSLNVEYPDLHFTYNKVYYFIKNKIYKHISNSSGNNEITTIEEKGSKKIKNEDTRAFKTNKNESDKKQRLNEILGEND